MAQPEQSNGAGAVAKAEPAIALQRVKQAYEQVADRIRELIVTGQIEPEDRLPNEATLAAQFGVSRATVREALRVLSTQSLIRTAKGSHGGSFATLPTATNISDSLGANVSLLSKSADVTLEEFLEFREFLEVPAARLAAAQRDEITLGRVRGAITGQPQMLDSEEHFIYNRDFHSAVIQATNNTMLMIALKPVFMVLRTHLRRAKLGPDFHSCVNRDHRAILAALEAGDGDAAAGEMRDHLSYLRPHYEDAWRYRRRDAVSSPLHY
jgi:GntR family transcriptional repressor for pyruvate dehydrogenase complex